MDRKIAKQIYLCYNKNDNIIYQQLSCSRRYGILSLHQTELICVSSLEAQSALRQLLTQNNITHSVSVRYPQDIGGFFPVADPTSLLNQEMRYQFYVSKQDYARAITLLQKEGFL